jgi:hypothetical protein
VLTLQEISRDGIGGNAHASHGADDTGGGVTGTAVAEFPPHVALSDTVTEAMLLAAKRRWLVIRHSSGDRIVALLEIVSPGNKEGRGPLDAFVAKAIGAFDEGYHLLLLDLLPPGPFDPRGIHGAVWQRLGGTYQPPAGRPLTLAAYAASGSVTCYVEPTAVGAALIPMPIFLEPGYYVNVPLELTYIAAYEGVPRRWKRVIEVPSSQN